MRIRLKRQIQLDRYQAGGAARRARGAGAKLIRYELKRNATIQCNQDELVRLVRVEATEHISDVRVQSSGLQM